MTSTYIILYYLTNEPAKVKVNRVDAPEKMQRILNKMFHTPDIVLFHWFKENTAKGLDASYAMRMARQWKTEAENAEDVLFSKQWINKILAEVYKIIKLLQARGGDVVEWQICTCGGHAPRPTKRLRSANVVANS